MTAVYTSAKHACVTHFCKAFQRNYNCKRTSQLPSDVEKQMYVSACSAAGIYSRALLSPISLLDSSPHWSYCIHLTELLEFSLKKAVKSTVCSKLCTLHCTILHIPESPSALSQQPCMLKCFLHNYTSVITWQYGTVMMICKNSLLATGKEWLSRNKYSRNNETIAWEALRIWSQYMLWIKLFHTESTESTPARDWFGAHVLSLFVKAAWTETASTRRREVVKASFPLDCQFSGTPLFC